MQIRKIAGYIASCVALILIFIAVACVYFGPHNSDNSLQKVTILLDWTPNTNHTGIYVAQKLGYFRDEGLEVTIQQPPQESSTALVAAGKVEFAVAFQDFLAPALTSDTPLPVKAVAAIAQHNTSGIVCKKSANIRTYADLASKNYSTFDNFIELALLKYCVESQGGRFENINLIRSQTNNIAAALGTNVDAAWGYFGIERIIATSFGIENDFLFFRDVDPVLDFYTPVLICNESYINRSPAVIRKVLTALSKGYSFAATHPKEAADILVECVPELDCTTTLESQKYMSAQYISDAPSWGRIDAARWNNFYDWLFEKRIIKRQIPHGSTFTNEFLPEC